ncbi:MAG TPA: hypothetical protein ENJ09_05630 [Planctomycetes bacterium]|nr:hypothetical protein [Planctomycetota bacterium]
MERSRSTPSSPSRTSRVERQLAPLKIVSRLLGHELHAQQSPRLTLTRDEVLEIQTTLDLYIESAMRGSKGAGTSAPSQATGELEVQAVPARVN